MLPGNARPPLPAERGSQVRLSDNTDNENGSRSWIVDISADEMADLLGYEGNARAWFIAGNAPQPSRPSRSPATGAEAIAISLLALRAAAGTVTGRYLAAVENTATDRFTAPLRHVYEFLRAVTLAGERIPSSGAVQILAMVGYADLDAKLDVALRFVRLAAADRDRVILADEYARTSSAARRSELLGRLTVLETAA